MNISTEQLAELLAGITRAQQAMIDAIESESAGWRNTHLLPKVTVAANLRLPTPRLLDVPSRILLRSQGRNAMDTAAVVAMLEEALGGTATPAATPSAAAPKPVAPAAPVPRPAVAPAAATATAPVAAAPAAIRIPAPVAPAAASAPPPPRPAAPTAPAAPAAPAAAPRPIAPTPAPTPAPAQSPPPASGDTDLGNFFDT